MPLVSSSMTLMALMESKRLHHLKDEVSDIVEWYSQKQKKLFDSHAFPMLLLSPNIASWPYDFATKFSGKNSSEEMFSQWSTFQMSLNKGWTLTQFQIVGLLWYHFILFEGRKVWISGIQTFISLIFLPHQSFLCHEPYWPIWDVPLLSMLQKVLDKCSTSIAHLKHLPSLTLFFLSFFDTENACFQMVC